MTSTNYPARPDPVTKTNLDSMKHVYSISAPKTFPEQWRTHVDIRSVLPFRFVTSDWQRLSDSDPYHRYLAVNPDGSEMRFHGPAGDPAHRAVPPSAIVLTEYRAEEKVYVAHVPGLGQVRDLASTDEDRSEIGKDRVV
jgi:hypothetical protein